ncbi:hypothetical protein BJX99DRAFT_56086 [Aspergillus californicus]
MRLRLIPNRLLNSSSTDCCRRSFHHGLSRAKDSTIFENSLEKTLEVHRSTNRRSLIRKVSNHSVFLVPDTPIVPSTKPAAPKALSRSPTPGLSKRVKRTTRTPKRTLNITENSASRRVQWEVRDGQPYQCPWLNEMCAYRVFSGGLSQLDAEIRALEKYLTPTAREEAAVHEAVDAVTKDLSGMYSNALHVVGSRRTKFAMSHSDLNIMLLVSDPARLTSATRKPSANRPEILHRYAKLNSRLHSRLVLSSSYRLQSPGTQSAQTAIHKPTGLQLQFRHGEEVPVSVEYVQDFQAEYPYTRRLYMAVRLILESKGLFGLTKQSLTPFALQMLVVAFFKLNHGRFSRENGCGEALLAFLRTFGTDLDLATTGIAVDPPGFFNIDSVKDACAIYNPDDLPAHLRGQRAFMNGKRSAATAGNQPLARRLCLQDPANYLNDLGGHCTRIPELQFALAEAYAHLKLALDAWEPSKSESGTVGKHNSLLGTVLRADFYGFELRRADIVAAS